MNKKYQLEKMVMLGSGSSRLVFDNPNDPKTVLKFAINKFGTVQNQDEYQNYLNLKDTEVSKRLAISFHLYTYYINGEEYNILEQEKLNVSKDTLLLPDYIDYCSIIQVISPSHNKSELFEYQQIGVTEDGIIKCIDYAVINYKRDSQSLVLWFDTKVEVDNKMVTKMETFLPLVNVKSFRQYFGIKKEDIPVFFNYLYPYGLLKVRNSDTYLGMELTDEDILDVLF